MSKCHHGIAEGLGDYQGIRRQKFEGKSFKRAISVPLNVVLGALGNAITRHLDILDHNGGAHMARRPNPGGAGTNPAGDLEEVVRRPLGLLPGVTLVRGDFELGCPASGAHDLRAEPILRDAALHVD